MMRSRSEECRAKRGGIGKAGCVGNVVSGGSWAALYLARGLNGTATDPAPDAEANLRRYIDAAWKDLTIIGLSKNASRDHLKFTPDLKKALADADLVQENGPERKDFKIKLFADMAAATRPDAIIASSSSGLTMSTMQSASSAIPSILLMWCHWLKWSRAKKLLRTLSSARSHFMNRLGRNRFMSAKRLSAT